MILFVFLIAFYRCFADLFVMKLFNFPTLHFLLRTAKTSRMTVLILNLRSSPLEMFGGKRCSKNMQKIYKRTTMLNCDFNKVAKRLY